MTAHFFCVFARTEANEKRQDPGLIAYSPRDFHSAIPHKPSFWETRCDNFRAALVQQRGHASTTDLPLLPPPSAPPPSLSHPPSTSVVSLSKRPPALPATYSTAAGHRPPTFSTASRGIRHLLQSRNRAILPLVRRTSLSLRLILSHSLRCWAPDSTHNIPQTRTRPVPRNGSNPPTRCSPSVAKRFDNPHGLTVPIVRSQVTLNPSFVPPSFSLSFLLPPHRFPSLALPLQACACSCILYFLLQTLPSDQPSRLSPLTSAVAFCYRSYPASPLAKRSREQPTDMAQHQQPHNNPSGLVASRLNQQQSIQQGFQQGMIGGNPNPGQPSQGKFLH